MQSEWNDEVQLVAGWCSDEVGSFRLPVERKSESFVLSVRRVDESLRWDRVRVWSSGLKDNVRISHGNEDMSGFLAGWKRWQR
jgi:hypothetical protein